MLRVAIVDDEADVRESLSSMLTRYAQERSIELATSEYADGSELLAAGAPEDIILMDIEMAEVDGMEASRRLRAAGVTSELIFVTNMAQYAIKGYEVGALDFVVKPVRYPTFALKLDRAIEIVRRKLNARISVATRDGLRTVNTSDITYVEVIRHKLIYHIGPDALESWDSMKNARASLEPYGFALCNSCYLVNLDKVMGVGAETVTVEGGSELKMSRGKKREFLDALTRSIGA